MWSGSHELKVNPVKFTKTCKISQIMLEILPNTCIFELICWGCLLATKLKMYLKKHSKSTRCSWINVAKKWAVVTLLKALPLVHFSRRLLLKEQMKISVVVKQIAKRLLYFFRSKSQQVVQLTIISKKNKNQLYHISFLW